MSVPQYVRLTVPCPKCKQEVSLTLTKRDVKMLLKGFKRPKPKPQPSSSGVGKP